MPTAFQNHYQSDYGLDESAVITRFRENLREKNVLAENEFWEKVERETVPVFEELVDDSENIACIFLFKGDETTRNVFVNLPPFSRIAPEDFQMSRVEGTNVWFVSVKLPVKSRFAYSLVVNSPFYAVNPQSQGKEIAAFRAASKIDSLNPNRLNNSHSFIETPQTEALKYLEKRGSQESGKVKSFVLKSEILGNERTISVYTPPSYNASVSYPLLVLFDENIYLKEISAAQILDNLYSENRIPQMITVFVGNAPQMRETELPCNPHFSEFMVTELFERLKESYKITDKPEETIIGGASFGGLGAVYTGLSYPKVFGKILSQSGSFWRNFEDITDKIIAQNSSSAQKIYLDAGIFEIEQRNEISLLEANRNLQKLLSAKNYAVEYAEFRGGHGAINWRATFAEAIIFLTGDLIGKRNLTGNPNLF